MIAFNGRLHWRFGLILWGMLFVGGIYTNPLGAIIGSLLPDSDTNKTLIGKFLPFWLIFKHRTWTHTMWALLIFGGIAWFLLGKHFAGGLIIGYLSHLMMDSCTPAGVQWFRVRNNKKATR